MNYATIVHEMYDDFSDGLGVERTPTAPTVPMDDPLFGFDKKAQDHNRLPARIVENDWIRKVSTGNVQIIDDAGNPATVQKHVPNEPDDDADEPVEISPELRETIEKISGFSADAAWRLTATKLTKVAAQPMQKRASSKAFCGDPDLANADPHFDRDRKVLSVERKGRLKITRFQGGELLEICEDE